MAKRKLSEQQRKALRGEIESRLDAGDPKREVVKTLSAKYRISPISMRWYLRTQDGGGNLGRHPKARRQGSAPFQMKSVNGSSSRFRPRGPADIGQSLQVAQVLNRFSEQGLRRLIAAKKLVPELETLRRNESALRGRIRDLERKLQLEEGRARLIERRIRQLSGL